MTGGGAQKEGASPGRGPTERCRTGLPDGGRSQVSRAKIVVSRCIMVYLVDCIVWFIFCKRPVRSPGPVWREEARQDLQLKFTIRHPISKQKQQESPSA